MYLYTWSGINQEGKIIQGLNQAKNRQQLQNDLLRENILPLKIKLNLSSIFQFNSKVKTKNIAYLIEQLAALINANMPIIKALTIISQDEINPTLKNLTTCCKNSIAEGKSLYKSLRQYPQYFTEFMCNIINVGEQSGTLDIMLTELSNHLKKNQAQNRKIINMILYPISILLVTLITTAILLIVVIPQLALMFDSLGAQLPGYTRLIINLSALLQQTWPFILGSIVTIIVCVKTSYKHLETCRIFWDKINLSIPLIKNILTYTLVFHFTRTLSLTLKSGVPLIKALNISSKTLTNWQYHSAIQKVSRLIIDGKSLYRSLEEQKLFPAVVVQLIALGEETGSLDMMLEKISLIYQEKLNTLVDRINNLLEPIIMLVLGTIVGGLVIGMYLPIFRLGLVI